MKKALLFGLFHVLGFLGLAVLISRQSTLEEKLVIAIIWGLGFLAGTIIVEAIDRMRR